LLHLGPAEPEPLDQPVVEDEDTSRRDGPHRELLVPGDADLPDDEHVERRAELSRELVGHRDAAARKAEHDHVVAARVVGEVPGEDAPRLGAIAESRDARSTAAGGDRLVLRAGHVSVLTAGGPG
jgi:hypothetical protein